MDVMQALRYWNQHNETVMAVLALMFLATLVLLLMRSIGNHANGDLTPPNRQPLDIAAIEVAFRQVLAQTPGSAARVGSVGDAAVPTAIGAGGADSTGATAVARQSGAAAGEVAASEANKRVEVLQRELEQTQLELAARVAEKDAIAIDGAANPSQADLKKRLLELEARLAEYEIIEDDIADLSTFRDENTRLREQLAALQQPNSAAVATSASAASALAEIADAESGETADDLMKQFEAAVEGNAKSAAPANASEQLAKVAAEQSALEALAKAIEEPVNTDKMLAEVATLPVAESDEDAGGAPVFDDTLDAEKLLREASDLGGAAIQNDILGEFKDDKKDQKKGAT